MVTISSYYNELVHCLGIFSWKDILEIIFFSSIIYYFSRWLKQNQTQYLLTLFYGFCTLAIWSHFFQFFTINSFLLHYGPALLMLFILVHQETLQKNFVTLKNIKPTAPQQQSNWLEILMRTCLRARNAHKSLIGIIQQDNDLSLVLDAPFIMETPLNDQLLSLVLESPQLDPEKIVWFKKNGSLHAVNVSWKKPVDNTWLDEELKKQDPWLVQALALTQKNDSLVFKSDAASGTFDVVAQGKLVENISATNTLRIIRHYLNISPEARKQKGEFLYEKSHAQKSSLEQSHS